ncbi:MAG TPA: isocitrate lyase/PEP mutase family protein [Steroidobacteraceae bacterium]|jgi:methylisocitrate lyase
MIDFRSRVTAQKTVLAAGAYDALSALIIERSGFEAVVASGLGIAASAIGRPDAGLYTMTENLDVVRNMAATVKIPVIADIDTGYGNALNVMRTVREFERAGVSAIIIEDQVAPKRCPVSVLGVEVISVEEAEGKIRAAVDARQNPETVIIARTDVMDEAAAIERARRYVIAGADLIQPISRTFRSIQGLQALRQGSGAPLSLQLFGWLEADLSNDDIASVAGLATYPFVALLSVASALQENLSALAAARSTAALPAKRMALEEFNALIGFPDILKMQEHYLPGGVSG